MTSSPARRRRAGGRGVAEVVGVPETLLATFSTRRGQIDAELARTGGAGRAAAQRACYKQLPEIDAGGLFAALARREPITLTGRDPYARRLAGRMARGARSTPTKQPVRE